MSVRLAVDDCDIFFPLIGVLAIAGSAWFLAAMLANRKSHAIGPSTLFCNCSGREMSYLLTAPGASAGFA
jgi:hypothetical protein